jgi:error-prone DNA polymerase
MGYTELQVTTNFSFLRGASHPEEIAQHAYELGYSMIGITDRNSLAGVVRAHVAAKNKGIRLIVGCRLDLEDGHSLLAYPTTKRAYAGLCKLLSTGNLRTEKGKCLLYKTDVYAHKEGIHFIVLPPDSLDHNFEYDQAFIKCLQEYRSKFGSYLSLAASRMYDGDDTKKLFQLYQLSKSHDVPMVATNDVYYHEPGRRELQDILTCVREKCTIVNAGFLLLANAERHLKPTSEMMRLFRQYPDAITRTQEIANACQFSLDELKYVYPSEITTEGRTPQEEITMLAWKGAHEIYGKKLPEKITQAIQHELRFIEEMNYASYFLTVYDIVRFARSKDILCQGRGSAANSTICFVIGITSVDPTKFELLFERFISSARNEPPDIDVDFEHERREEVIQYIYNKYGRERAAIVATVTQQRQKGALRDVGKAMGISEDTIKRLSGVIWEYSDEWYDDDSILKQGLNPHDPFLKKVLQLTRQMLGFPRQLGQHTGGFVITQGPITELCPIINARMADRTNIEWNKDDIDALGILKVDVLALGMLTCIRKAFELGQKHYQSNWTLANIPQDDPEVYKMISNADTIGVFQIESRAQQSMLPRLQPKEFYDLVIEVAIVRPGPIQGDMVHPYLRRRNNLEKVEYPSKELEEILKRTLGVPLFQEQAMRIAIVCAGFTPTEADQLRRSMATFKAKGLVSKFQQKMVQGMISRGYDEAFALRVFKQLEGFGSYGFPESHAASFALLVYISSWLKCYFPDIFACGLLNSMPMGFYQPAQIVGDARKHCVELRPVDVNHSFWDNTLEEQAGKYRALRLGFRQVNGVRQADIDILVSHRVGEYTSISALADAGVSHVALEKLAEADAFRSMGLDRRHALWEVSALSDRPTHLFKGQPSNSTYEPQVSLPFMSTSEHVIYDYATTALSLKAHPVSFVREKLSLLNVSTSKDLPHLTNGTLVRVAGLVLVKQRPGTAKGVCFITLEDEYGSMNVLAFANIFEKFRKEIMAAKMLMVEGTLQIEGQVIHVIIKSCFNISRLLRQLSNSNESTNAISENKKQQTLLGKQEDIFPDSRNFK